MIRPSLFHGIFAKGPAQLRSASTIILSGVSLPFGSVRKTLNATPVGGVRDVHQMCSASAYISYRLGGAL